VCPLFGHSWIILNSPGQSSPIIFGNYRLAILDHPPPTKLDGYGQEVAYLLPGFSGDLGRGRVEEIPKEIMLWIRRDLII